jgi:hypothetical protein
MACPVGAISPSVPAARMQLMIMFAACSIMKMMEVDPTPVLGPVTKW